MLQNTETMSGKNNYKPSVCLFVIINDGDKYW